MAGNRAAMCPRVRDGKPVLELRIQFEEEVAPDSDSPPEFTIEYHWRTGRTLVQREIETTYVPPGAPRGDSWLICAEQKRFLGQIMVKGRWSAGATATTPGARHEFDCWFDAGTAVNRRRVTIYLPGPKIAVLCTGRDGYGVGALEYWKDEADRVIQMDEPALSEVIERLDAEVIDDRDWGEVNIVVHGREKLLAMRLFPDSQDENIHRDGVKEQVRDRSLPKASSVSDRTNVIFRACNAGRTQDLVDLLHTHAFPGAHRVCIPRFVQRYDWHDGAPLECFEESLTYASPTRAEALPAGVPPPERLQLAFADLESLGSPGVVPGPADRDAELPTFTEVHDWTHTVQVTQPVSEGDTLDANGATRSNTEMADWINAEKWDDLFGEQPSQVWDLPKRDWTLAVVSRRELPLPAGSTILLLRLQGTGTSPRRVQEFGSGAIGIGSDSSEPDLWSIQAPGVSPRHVDIEIVSSTSIRVVHRADSTAASPVRVAPEGGATVSLAVGADATCSLPATIHITGSTDIRATRSRLFEYTARVTRFVVDRRRWLRRFRAGTPYADRQLVNPEPENSVHFGISS